MKKSALTLLAIICFSGVANARAVDHRYSSGPPNTLEMTCAETQKYVGSNDGATLATRNLFGRASTNAKRIITISIGVTRLSPSTSLKHLVRVTRRAFLTI